MVSFAQASGVADVKSASQGLGLYGCRSASARSMSMKLSLGRALKFVTSSTVASCAANSS